MTDRSISFGRACLTIGFILVALHTIDFIWSCLHVIVLVVVVIVVVVVVFAVAVFDSRCFGRC